MGVALVLSDRSPVGSEAGATLAHRWAEALATDVPRTPAELLPTTTGLVERLLAALRTARVDVTAARRVGAALVSHGLVGAAVLESTVRVLATGLPLRTPGRLGELIGAVCAGFTRGLERQRTLPFVGSRIGLWIADLDGTVLALNDTLADMLDAPAKELIGQPMRLLPAGSSEHLRVRRRWQGADGLPLHVDVVVNRVGDLDDAGSRLVGMVESVADAAAQQPDRDTLTGLPHRSALFDALATDQDTLIGLCYLDLDRFKAVNDAVGYDGGDDVLRTIGRRLDAEIARDGHLVARTGGDEFAVLVHGVPGTARRDLDQLLEVSERVLAIVRRPVRVGDDRLPVTASAGVVRRERGREGAELMHAAGTTLSRAKEAGRDRIALFDADLHDHDVSRLAMITRMPQALADGEFSLQYQPLVRMGDGRLVGVEALVRWTLPSGEQIEPGQFVPVAEETGMIVPLGRWVLAEACRQAAAWLRGGGPRLVMSVNLAARQVDDPGIVDAVEQALLANALPAHTLQLELTESEIMGPTAVTRAVLEALAALGVRLAIDDFGTGYSNLAYLRSLPVHALKLAEPFVTGTGNTAGGVDVEITSMLVGLAHALGLTVTAEAVETAEQATQLRDLGCDLAQGWYFSPAVGATDVPALAERRLGTP